MLSLLLQDRAILIAINNRYEILLDKMKQEMNLLLWSKIIAVCLLAPISEDPGNDISKCRSRAEYAALIDLL